MKLHVFIKPLSHYINYRAIIEKAKSISIDDLLTALLYYDIYAEVVKVNGKELFIVYDYESKYGDYVKVSDIITYSYNPGLIALNRKLGCKIFTEDSLRRILAGIWIHEAYKFQIGFLVPARCEVKCVDCTLRIVGIADLVGPDFVVEIKSSSRRLKYHVLQLAAYLYMLRISEGYLVYPKRVKKITLTRDLLERLCNLISKIRQIYENPDEYLARYRIYLEKIYGVSLDKLLTLAKRRKF